MIDKNKSFKTAEKKPKQSISMRKRTIRFAHPLTGRMRIFLFVFILNSSR